MNEFPPLPTAQLKLVVTDPEELAKGLAIADRGGLKHLARHGSKLFAEAEGSGSAPYKVQIVHDPEKGYRGRCSCMAARSRPFCKHAAALVVLWARDTNAFAVAEAAPETAGEPGAPARRAKAKTGKVDTNALMRQGVEQTMTLVRELALSGITTMSEERIAQVRALAETLRAERLRRMSARLLELAATLSVAARDYAALDSEDYGAALADLWLAARRVQKHLDGEALPAEHVETLIGRSWTKKDRTPVQGLDLVEYAFVQELTPDDFVIRESRFLDLASGTHYSEKQILPAFLAKRTAPKRSYEGFLLGGAGGGRYPGFAPHRLDLSETGALQPLAADAISRIGDQALPGVATALARLSDYRKDVFAPDNLPVAVRVDSLLGEGERLLALDESGDSLMIAGEASAQIALTSALAGAHLRVILGDLLLLGAIPALQPLAMLVERNGTAALEILPAVSAEALLGARKRKSKEPAPGRRPRWIDTARELGVNSAAIALGEVREELADILSEGLSALTSRRADGLVERLHQLNLAKPAALLAQTAQHADPAQKIDDVVRLLQVLGIGLTRLAASRNVDRSRLARSPLHPAIMVFPPEQILNADGLVQELYANRLVGHGRAIAIDRALGTFDEPTLVRLAPTLFGDGSVSSLVAQRYAAHPRIALELARDFLAEGNRYTMKGWSAPARVARYTAVQTLQRIASPAASQALRSVWSESSKDKALQNLIRRALAPDSTEKLPEAILDGLKAGNWETRAQALARVVDQGCLAALPHVRRIAATDPSLQARYRAWYAQAALLDVDAVPLWIAALRTRAANDDAGREALHALAHIGDNRAIAPLLDAFEEGYKPTLVSEALHGFGPAILAPLLDRLEARPELVERKVTLDVGAGVNGFVVSGMLAQRLAVLAPQSFTAGALVYLKFFSKNPYLQKAVATLVQARIESHGMEVPGDLKRALSRAFSKAK